MLQKSIKLHRADIQFICWKINGKLNSHKMGNIPMCSGDKFNNRHQHYWYLDVIVWFGHVIHLHNNFKTFINPVN